MQLFIGSFVITVVGLALTIWSGHTQRRSLHAIVSVLTAFALSMTDLLFMAYLRDLVVNTQILAAHLFFICFTFGTFLWTVGRGVTLARGDSWPPGHREASYWFIGSFTVMTVTGIWLIATAIPI